MQIFHANAIVGESVPLEFMPNPLLINGLLDQFTLELDTSGI